MSKDMTVLITYPRTFYSGINSETTHITFVDLRVANEIARSEDTNICYIRAGVLIPRLSPKASAQVIHPFSIQLSLTEEGYVATSPLCNIYEIEKTKGEAVRSYLYSLTDELIWLQKHEETLSKPLREELNRIKMYIRIV